MFIARFFGLACGLAASMAMAQAPGMPLADPNMNCADYLKLAESAGPTPKTGDAALDKMADQLDAKMKAYCTANPKAKAMEAAEKALAG